MKRTLSLLLALLMLLTAIACASSTIPEENQTDLSVTAETSNEEIKGVAAIKSTEPKAETSAPTEESDAASETSDETSAPSPASFDKTSSDSASSGSAPAVSTGKTDSTSSDNTDKKIDSTEKPDTSKTTDTRNNSGFTDTPSQKPSETEPPKETTPKTEPPAETTPPKETEPPVTSEPTQPTTPKTAYDYEFDINQIRKDMIALAKGYGLTLDESLTPSNASWANPVFATKSTQGDLLKRQLTESIQYYADKEYRASLGLSDLGLTYFNIYCEPLGGGEYRIFFLNY